MALLALFSLALWLGTLSLIVLAASLFTLAHLKGWSRRLAPRNRFLYPQPPVLDRTDLNGPGSSSDA